MKITNEFKCVFPAVSANEALARASLSAFLIPADPTAQELADLRTVISEAVTNAIVHGYRNSSGEVSICLRMLPNRVLYIRVSDKGCGIPDIQKAMEPLYTSVPEEERAGLGFAIMQEFTDNLHVRSTPNHGTTLTMRRRLGQIYAEE
ncbi:MAG: anti-sigma F factor [Oscillospiraceae bacterium]|nr:anti-sigma F factor [Oscillospiraceae bacterium]MDE6777678.1 anti-sigma F factor [Oscillospiraceae bacterium]MDE7093878.1 anti-sigma F factor [Oscillospiraceae bacterium]